MVSHFIWDEDDAGSTLFTLQNAGQAMVAKKSPKLYEKVRFLQSVPYEQIANIGIGLGLQNLNNTSSILVLFSYGAVAEMDQHRSKKPEIQDRYLSVPLLPVKYIW